MKIGEVASQTSVPAKTIRFWEQSGILPLPIRTESHYRNYDPAIFDRIAFIRQAQTAGLTLAQIRRVLEIAESGEPPCEHVAEAIKARLNDVEARIAELRATRARLREMASRAAAQDPRKCNGYCSIIVGSTAAKPTRRPSQQNRR